MIRKNSTCVFVSLCCLFFLNFCIKNVFADGLMQPLKMGMTSPDVQTLQQILNSDPDTQIAASGPGSKGQETTYFGLKTQQAVINFQNKYSSDILIPAGLLSGNGFVGPLTLKKLNTLMTVSVSTPTSSSNSTDYAHYGGTSTNSASSSTSSATSSPDTILNILTQGQNMTLFSVSELKTTPGSTIIATGLGFDSTQNTVHLGSYSINNVVSTDSGMQLSFTIPQTIPLGTYHIWITTPKGSTEHAKLQIPITIGSTVALAPAVISISPQTVTPKDTITLTGTGFTSSNGVYTTLGKITNISSPDGKTITFKVSDLPGLKTLKSNTKVTVGLAVGNENGPEVHPTTIFILNND